MVTSDMSLASMKVMTVSTASSVYGDICRRYCDGNDIKLSCGRRGIFLRLVYSRSHGNGVNIHVSPRCRLAGDKWTCL